MPPEDHTEVDENGANGAPEPRQSEQPSGGRNQRSPEIATRRVHELEESVAQLRTGLAHAEAQIRHLTDFVRYLCKIEGYRIPEAFVPLLPEARKEAETKPEPGKK